MRLGGLPFEDPPGQSVSVPQATTIPLAKGAKPSFPPLCIVCHSLPDSEARLLIDTTSGWLSVFFPILHLFGWRHFRVPTCRPCKWTLRAQRWGRNLVAFAIGAAAIGYFASHYAPLPRTQRKWALFATVCAALVPWMVIEALWPRYIDVTTTKDTTNYDFASEDYARAFAAINEVDFEDDVA